MSVASSHISPSIGRLVHHTWRPSAADPLAPYVEAIVDCDGVVLHPRERLLPSGALDMVVHLDEPYGEVTPRGPARFPTACLTGILSGPMLMQAPSGRTRIVAIRFRPAGARALLALPLSEVGGRTIDVAAVVGRASEELADRCHDGRGADDRIAAARRWLEPRLRDPGDDAPLVAWAVAEIARRRGALPIDALRDRTGLSWARLAAAFRDQLGVTPKRYARIVRFRHALALLDTDDARPLSAVALDAGYYDQAHMNADFRALGGLTPAQLRARPRYPDVVSVAEPAR